MTQHQTIDTNSAEELHMEHVFNAPIETVFKAWTDEKMLSQWMGPEHKQCPDAKTDPRLGGSYSIPMVGEDTDIVVGEYTEFLEPHALSFTWSWIQEDGQPGQKMEVFLKFKSVDDNKTHMQFLQTNFISVEAMELHKFGWTGSFNCLDKYLAQQA